MFNKKAILQRGRLFSVGVKHVVCCNGIIRVCGISHSSRVSVTALGIRVSVSTRARLRVALEAVALDERRLRRLVFRLTRTGFYCCPDGVPCAVLWRSEALDCRVLIPPEIWNGSTREPPSELSVCAAFFLCRSTCNRLCCSTCLTLLV